MKFKRILLKACYRDMKAGCIYHLPEPRAEELESQGFCEILGDVPEPEPNADERYAARRAAEVDGEPKSMRSRKKSIETAVNETRETAVER